jgi:gluconolactonase
MQACVPDRKIRPVGFIEVFDPALVALIDTTAVPEILGEGFEWSEGPVWVEKHRMLLFSDIPNNAIMKWTEEKGVEPYLSPAGYTGEQPFKGSEGGSNGLLISPEGQLVLCQHGDRRLAVMDAPFDAPAAVFKTIADRYDGKRFNSPNDAVYDKSGNLYLTDPPYGLPGYLDDPGKELPFQGVYKVKTDGSVILLVDSLTRPNGIGFSPDEKTLYVANSDGPKAKWYAFDVSGDSLINARIFFSMDYPEGEKGAPDGLKVSKTGHIFATGPGGVWIFDPSGKALGRIRLPEATANCAFSADEAFLFMTSDMYLVRLKLKKD